MGRVSRGPPLRTMASIGGGGRTPALKRMRWTGSEGCAPTDNQYLHAQVTKECYERIISQVYATALPMKPTTEQVTRL